MRPLIVQSTTFLTLLGGSSTHFGHLDQALRLAPILVTADGGADLAIESGHAPAHVIGDMDSISQTAQNLIPRENQHLIEDQDGTDFDKCLRHIQAPAILALGFSGGRLDHQLAACTTLVRHPDQRCVMIAQEDVCFLAPLAFTIDLPSGTAFSLFPMGAVEGRSTGLKYPIDGLKFTPDGQVGTSNEVTGPVKLSFDKRLMLVLLPVAHLELVLEVLAGPTPGADAS